MTETRKLTAVMFTDIAGYTAQMSKDEQKALALLQKNREMQQSLAKKHNGEFLKEMGDGTLLCFQSALDAVRCAMEIQQSVKDDSDLNLRIGIHLGDIVFKEGDVFGDGVNVASRIEKLAESGGICISGQVYKTVKNQHNINVRLIGNKRLKHVEDPVEIYILTGKSLSGAQRARKYQKGTRQTGQTPSLKILFPALGALSLVLIFLILWPLFKKDKISTDKEFQNSIAVLPFVDMSPQKDQEYFCDGMADELIDALTKVTGLRVASRTSSFQFKDKGYSIHEIGKKLNVKSVLEGSIRKDGNKLRITAQLVDVSSGYHLWSEKYDREMEDIFTIQDEISLAIVDNLKIKLLSDERTELARHYTENKEAFNLYLQGRYYWNWRNEVGFNKALDFFNRAIEIDPQYARAYAGLAECYCMLSIRLAKSESVLRKGRVAAEKALMIDETLAEAHNALGWIKFMYDWDWLGSERSYKQAIRHNPRYATTYNWYAVLLSVIDRHEEAIQQMILAQRNDPESAIINRDLGIIYAWAGDLEKAINQLQFTINRYPDFIPAYFLEGVVHTWMGKYELAIENLLNVRAMTGDFFDVSGMLGYAYAKSGNREKALDELNRLLTLAETRDVRANEICLVHAALGNDDEVFKWLDIACENREFGVLLILGCELEYFFKDLMSDPRMKDFLIRVGL